MRVGELWTQFPITFEFKI